MIRLEFEGASRVMYGAGESTQAEEVWSADGEGWWVIMTYMSVRDPSWRLGPLESLNQCGSIRYRSFTTITSLWSARPRRAVEDGALAELSTDALL